MMEDLRRAGILLVLCLVATGAFYPAVVFELGHWLFPHEANGSLILYENKIIGSALIGQSFAQPRYFHARPSAAGAGYDPQQSGASNLPADSARLMDVIRTRLAAMREAGNTAPMPADLITASGSGLDPDISPAAANYQAVRVAKERGLDPAQINTLIASATQFRQFGFLGEARVNVLRLNLALDRLSVQAQDGPAEH